MTIMNTLSRLSCYVLCCWVGLCWLAAQYAGPVQAATNNDVPIVVQSDSGTRGGAVSLEALPNRGTTNSLKKTFTVDREPAIIG